MKKINFEELRYKADIEAICLKMKIKQQVEKAKDWAKENPQLAIAVVGTVASGIAFLGKNAIKSHNLNKQQMMKENYVYDPRLGHYWELKRKLNSNEWIDIDRRRANGERLSDILAELKVLK